MTIGLKKHMKRIGAPKSWMIAKKSKGIHITRPSSGPHKIRECMPLDLILRNKLKYALTYRETSLILNDKEVNVKVDGKLRRDRGFPVGINDVISIEKTGEKFRVLYDVKGRFVLKALKDTESNFKLVKVVKKSMGTNNIPYLVTNDARTIRFPNPEISVSDTLKYDFVKNKVLDFVKLDVGNSVFITGGNNTGRVG